ncbi:MAG: enoyl-CoA hydratase [Labilithrix sp.]|nr:enoyl-CoA hydratase [Labilithrix sp.]
MKTEWEDDVVTLTFDRPKALNSMDPELVKASLQAFLEVSGDPRCRAIVLTGEGRAFSAGGDVTWFERLQREGGSVLRDTIASFMEDLGNPFSLGIATCRVPVVTAVNGPAVGGGVGVALSADVTVMARSAYFLVPQVQELGIVPDLGATWVLARRLGRTRALGMSLLGERIDAETAERWGLVWKVAPDEALLSEAKVIARRLARAPAEAVRATRTLIDEAMSASYEHTLRDERREQRPLLETDYFKAACRKFVEKSASRK